MSNTDDMKEKLSALVDNELGELDERRVMAELGRDAELRRTWERYHLVRAALHRELDIHVATDMAARVAARIEAEPADAGHSKRRRTDRLVGTLAVAASVAAVAIAAVQWIHRPVTPPVAALVAGKPAPDNVARVAGKPRELREVEAENALNAFLVEHNEFASSSGIGGMMPYVRVVGHDNRK